MTFDLIVVGGGPAGCAATITAARCGAKVLQLERGRFPRHKVCGEFVSAESLSLLRQLIGEDASHSVASAPTLAEVRIFMNGVKLVGRISPPAASITRFDLDYALWRSAIQTGVDARENCVVQAVDGAGPFVVRTAEQVFEAKAVVSAAGRWSNLTSPTVRACAANERWVGVKAHFREAHPSSGVDLYFFDGGYCGVQNVPSLPPDGGSVVNASAMVRADVAKTLPEVFRAHPGLSERSRNWEPVTAPVSTSPLVFHKPEPLYDGVLQAGDAATFVDPFIGDGISLGLRSGALAAECLVRFLQGNCSLEQAASDYGRAYETKFGRIYRNSSRLRRMLAWPMPIRKPVLSFLEKTPPITNMLVRMTR
jgi:flavin-dependent dehydrogenase